MSSNGLLSKKKIMVRLWQKYPVINDIKGRDDLQESIIYKNVEKRGIIFSRSMMIFALALLFIAVYLFLQVSLPFWEAQRNYFIILYIIFSFSVAGIVLSSLINELSVCENKIRSTKNKVSNIDLKIGNRDKYRYIEKIARGLKYESPIDKDFEENYTKIKKILEEARDSLDPTAPISEELNYILYLIFHWDNNGFHSPQIIESLADLDLVKEILDYVMKVLRAGDLRIGLEYKKEEEAERFFLAIKKLLEGYYQKEKKELDKKEKLEKESQRSKEEMKEELDIDKDLF